MKSFENKVVMITGAARGQGRNHAVKFAELGAKLIVCDICEDIEGVMYSLGTEEQFSVCLEEITHKTNGQVVSARCDVRDSTSVTRLAEQGIKRFGRIDVLVNNAGVCNIKPAWEINDVDWDAMIGVNLTGTWNSCKAVIPVMKNQHYGRIINVGSIAAMKGIPNLVHYTAAKHGVAGLTKALAIDLAPYGITVNCICPGSVDTDMLAGLAPEIEADVYEAKTLFASYHLLPGLIQPEDTTELVMWLASDASRSVTGAVWNMDRGWAQR